MWFAIFYCHRNILLALWLLNFLNIWFYYLLSHIISFFQNFLTLFLCLLSHSTKLLGCSSFYSLIFCYLLWRTNNLISVFYYISHILLNISSIFNTRYLRLIIDNFIDLFLDNLLINRDFLSLYFLIWLRSFILLSRRIAWFFIIF